jgi:hypothetical protein
MTASSTWKVLHVALTARLLLLLLMMMIDETMLLVSKFQI